MKQLQDFDLSIIIPLPKYLDGFKSTFSLNARYYERNGIEVIVVLDLQSDKQEIFDYIYTLPFINWKIIINDQYVGDSSRVMAFNAGIRQASKQYVMILGSEVEFISDVIYDLRENLDSYPNHFAMGQVLFSETNGEVIIPTDLRCKSDIIPFNCIMAKKEYFELVYGYSEYYGKWNAEFAYLCKCFELQGIRQLFFPDSILIDRGYFTAQMLFGSEEQREPISLDVLSEILLPTRLLVQYFKEKWEMDRVLYDWKDAPFAKHQCREYLSKLSQYQISSDQVFDKSYSLIALIPAYNESKYISDCLLNIEKYCDGIILLDDGSLDDTYELAKSNKLLVKAQKIRTEFNDKQNRNILLDIASFFKSEWFIYIDADERFDDRFVDLNQVMRMSCVDTVGVWIANLWDKMDTYRTDMEDTNPNSKNGLWFRWRMFRNKGRMQIQINRSLHFSPIPYRKDGRTWKSKSLMLHLGYIDEIRRRNKYNFYQIEDKDKILEYDTILSDKCQLQSVENIALDWFV